MHSLYEQRLSQCKTFPHPVRLGCCRYLLHTHLGLVATVKLIYPAHIKASFFVHKVGSPPSSCSTAISKEFGNIKPNVHRQPSKCACSRHPRLPSSTILRQKQNG